MWKRRLSRTVLAAGTCCAVLAATVTPAAAQPAAQNGSLDKDVAELSRDVADLVKAIPTPEADRLYDSPVDRDTPLRRDTSKPMAGCTQGALLSYADKLTKQLPGKQQQAAGLLSVLGQLYSSGVATDSKPQVFGSDGQYTPRSKATITKLRKFWDIESWNIQLVAWKGTDTASKQKMTKTFGLGFAPKRAAQAAALANKVLFEAPALQGGRNPVLSLNAFSAPEGDLGGKRIALGDGILDALDTLGFDKVSAEAVIGHEFGHQLDFANDHSPSNESAEMGPDAYSGYFVTHANGESYDARDQQEVTYLDAAIGDCMHSHGTPAQRKAAGAWGEQLAANQPNPNRVLPSATMVAKWQKEYPKLNPPSSPAKQARTAPAGTHG